MERGSESDRCASEVHPAAFGHEEHTGLKVDDDDETLKNYYSCVLVLNNLFYNWSFMLKHGYHIRHCSLTSQGLP